jgi:hypothetical protein
MLYYFNFLKCVSTLTSCIPFNTLNLNHDNKINIIYFILKWKPWYSEMTDGYGTGKTSNQFIGI